MTQNKRNDGLSEHDLAWRTIPIDKEWSFMFHSFEKSAFRLEILQSYAEPSESSPFSFYQKGEMPNPEFMAGWCEIVREHTRKDRRMRRTHIVDLPLSEYLRFEVECCYYETSTAGEEIRLLDRALLSPDLQKNTLEDFWIFDGDTIMVNDYDPSGLLYQARITKEPKLVTYYSAIEQRIWGFGTPFKEFYANQTSK